MPADPKSSASGEEKVVYGAKWPFRSPICAIFAQNGPKIPSASPKVVEN
uniref:Uncharacterized protein n=1 Tax=Caulobacter phage BL57 TaxID=3348355 RepID=A0AB74UMI6_9VIRU